MLVVRFIFLFLISANIVFAADVSQFVFFSAPQTIKPNEVSEVLTVRAQDVVGNPVSSHPTACLELTTTSSTGQFSASSTNWGFVGKLMLTMNSNWANRNFYYKDSTAGNYILTAKAALISCSNWIEAQFTAEQNLIVSDDSTDLTATLEPTTVVGSNNAWPVEPQIYADAGADKTAVAGADIVFTGKALGLDKKPLDGARYLWSFGDGASAEGKSAKHFYKYPGEYILFLNVSSGEYSAGDGALVKIVPNQLKITEANSDFIKLKNDSNATLDISGWFLKSGDSPPTSWFKFPQTTLIKNGATLIIDSSISGINVVGGKAELLYPNGSVAITSPPTPLLQKERGAEGGVRIETKKTEIIPTDKNQEANVISAASQNEKNDAGTGKWLALASGAGIISAGGLIFIRRKGLL